jgi:cellulose synthase/poly-beta-1,6-N-acetylglucosamine synthase-like glycosyltransferase
MNLFPNTVAIVFWLCLGALFYAYLGYPVFIWCLARLFRRRPEFPGDSSAHLPLVSVLIAAYNEEAVIEARLSNALALDYPRDKLEIVVASDGSTDGTVDLVRKYEKQGVRLLNYKARRGKAAVLNSAFREVKGEIVLLSDANSHTEPDAARKLVRWFDDPEMGVVCGRLVLTDPHTGRNADSLYWKYETFLKRSEGRLGALLGANGAIYAIRRRVYTPIPDDTIVDDLVIPLLAHLHTGCAIAYDCEAIAHEETAPDVSHEFHRRSRIGAGGWQSMGLLLPLLLPGQRWVAFTFFSHKILRWLGPFFLLGMLGTSLALRREPGFQLLLLGQVAFYALSVLGACVPAPIKPLKALHLTTLFTGMNVALLLGFWRWLRGSQKAAWRRTHRRPVTKDPVVALNPITLIPEIPTPLTALNGNGRGMPEINLNCNGRGVPEINRTPP